MKYYRSREVSKLELVAATNAKSLLCFVVEDIEQALECHGGLHTLTIRDYGYTVYFYGATKETKETEAI